MSRMKGYAKRETLGCFFVDEGKKALELGVDIFKSCLFAFRIWVNANFYRLRQEVPIESDRLSKEPFEPISLNRFAMLFGKEDPEPKRITDRPY